MSFIENPETKHHQKGEEGAQAAAENCPIGDNLSLCTGLEVRGGTAPAALPHLRGPRANPSFRSHRSPSPQSSLVRIGSLPKVARKPIIWTLGSGGELPRQAGWPPPWKEMRRQAWGSGVMCENKAAVRAGQTGWSPKPFRLKPRHFWCSRPGHWSWGRLAPGAVYVQSGRAYANRTRRPLPQLCPQGAHIPVLTARFPLQGALQALPATGREPDTQRSPQTTPPRELLTPAGEKQD